MLKKYYLGGFSGASIPHKWYQNTSWFAGAPRRCPFMTFEKVTIVRLLTNAYILHLRLIIKRTDKKKTNIYSRL